MSVIKALFKNKYHQTLKLIFFMDFHRIVNELISTCNINMYDEINKDKKRIVSLAKTLLKKDTESNGGEPIYNFDAMKDGVLQSFTVRANGLRTLEYYVRLILAVNYDARNYDEIRDFVKK